MLNLFSHAMKTATRLDTWGAPDHWHRQHEDYRSHRTRAETERARLRRASAGQRPR